MEKRKHVPAADIYETQDGYTILLEMPGIDRATLSVQLDDEKLVVDASSVPVDQKWKAVDTEFDLGEYHRVFRVGPKINPESIEALYQDGILRITLHKMEGFKPRQIEVKTA